MTFDELLNHIPGALAGLQREVERLRAEVQELKHADRLTYNLREAAAAMGLSYDALYQICKAGEIKYVQAKEFGSILVEREELLRWIRSKNGSPQVREIETITMARPVRRRKRVLQVSHKGEGPKGNRGD